MATFKLAHKQHGISIIELMVGVVIGLLAVLVIYQMFTVSEGFKRNTTSMADSQQNGLFSSFTLGIELANAGNGLADAALDLASCAPTNDIVTSLSPIPVLITDSGDPLKPDSFVVNYSVANTLVVPALFQSPSVAGADYNVQSPSGFKANDVVVAIAGVNCAVAKVNAVTAPDANGVVTISYTGATVGGASVLFNMGQANRIQKARYDVDANGVLRSTSLIDPNTGQPDNAQPVNPLASNVVNMKLQYGVDDVGDGLFHTWVPATGDWDPTALLALTQASLPLPLSAKISRIKAVRIGIVVRGEQFDKNYNQAATWSLFDGTVNGSIAAAPGGGNWRLRTYETVIPLRNEIWNWTP